MVAASADLVKDAELFQFGKRDCDPSMAGVADHGIFFHVGAFGVAGTVGAGFGTGKPARRNIAVKTADSETTGFFFMSGFQSER